MNFHPLSCALFSLLCSFLSLSLSFPFILTHNWPTHGRAEIATTAFPCLPRTSLDPEIQVGPNQAFQSFWSTGHGNNCALFNMCPNPVVFVIVKAEDVNNMPSGNAFDTMVETYKAEAPPSAFLTGDMWTRNHLVGDFQGWDATYYDYFTGQPLNSSSPNYIELAPAVFMRGKYMFLGFSQNWQFAYQPQHVTTDWRAEYTNPKYPWVESIHWFDMIELQTNFYAQQYDFANFRVPALKGPGAYINFFSWNGYYECIDIDVQPQETANPYGLTSFNSSARAISYLRVDHAELAQLWNPATPCRTVPKDTMDISQCQSDCRLSEECQAIQVTRLTNPSMSLSKVVNLPTLEYTGTDNDSNDPEFPCTYRTVYDRAQNGCNQTQPMCNLTALQADGAMSDDYVCFGTYVNIDNAVQATQPYFIAEDTLDARFFSSIFFKAGGVGFLPYPSPPPIVPSWRAGDYAISCPFINNLANLPPNIAPNWEDGLILSGPAQDCNLA